MNKYDQAVRNVQAAVDHLAERGSGTIPMEFDDLNGVLGKIEILERALCWGIAAALNENKKKGLPLEWSPDGGIGKMLAALGISATTLIDEVWDIVQQKKSRPPKGAASK